MILRRAVLLGAAALPLPAGAADLKDQPPLPPPLPRLRELSLQDAAGKATTLGALVGAPRPTIVSFWATWCAPCAMEGRELARIRSRFAHERLAIVGINVDANADAAKLETFRRKAQMNYVQALGGKAAYAGIAGPEPVALPRTYVFDAAGRPVAAFGRYFGNRTLKALSEAVTAAMRT